MNKLRYKTLKITMPDGSLWGVPAEIIAQSHASYHRKFYDGDTEAALYKETIPLFNNDENELIEWAENNMNWDDVKESAFIIKKSELNFEDGWINGEKELSK